MQIGFDILCKLSPRETVCTISERIFWENNFLIFPENRLGHFIQMVSLGDDLLEMPQPIFRGKIRIR